MIRYWLIALLGTLLTGASQTLLKVGARRAKGKPWFRLYGQPMVVFAYTLFLVTMLLNLSAYSVLPLKFATALLPFNFIFVGLFSWAFLGEHLTHRQMAGVGLILLGVLVFNL